MAQRQGVEDYRRSRESAYLRNQQDSDFEEEEVEIRYKRQEVVEVISRKTGEVLAIAGEQEKVATRITYRKDPVFQRDRLERLHHTDPAGHDLRRNTIKSNNRPLSGIDGGAAKNPVDSLNAHNYSAEALKTLALAVYPRLQVLTGIILNSNWARMNTVLIPHLSSRSDSFYHELVAKGLTPIAATLSKRNRMLGISGSNKHASVALQVSRALGENISKENFLVLIGLLEVEAETGHSGFTRTTLNQIVSAALGIKGRTPFYTEGASLDRPR